MSDVTDVTKLRLVPLRRASERSLLRVYADDVSPPHLSLLYVTSVSLQTNRAYCNTSAYLASAWPPHSPQVALTPATAPAHRPLNATLSLSMASPQPHSPQVALTPATALTPLLRPG